jgi:hypothetical protein
MNKVERGSRGRRLLGLAPAVAVAAALVAGVAAAPASASVVGKCSGKRIDRVPITWHGKKAGAVELYYDRGYNCAMTRDYLPGKAKMSADLAVCKSGNRSYCRYNKKSVREWRFTPFKWWYQYSDGIKLWAGGVCVAFFGDYYRGGDVEVEGKGMGHCS